MVSTFHIVGAGWAGKLAAYWLLRHFPKTEIHIWDQRPGFDSSHTWSFFETDIPKEVLPILQELPHTRWSHHSVHFPQFSREIPIAYWSIEEDQLNRFLLAQADLQWHWGKSIKDFHDLGAKPTQVVIWATGWPSFAAEAQSLHGWQKFVGLKLRLKYAHRLTTPIIMDARIPQKDGYRFFYVLPYSDHDLLVEDTYYSQNTSLDVPGIKEEIFRYTQTQFGSIGNVLHEEVGCLPIPLWPPSVSDAQYTNLILHKKHSESGSCHETHPRVFTLGVSAGAFHPVTGYSSEALFKQLITLGDHLGISHDGAPPITSSSTTDLTANPSRQPLSSLIWYLLNQFLFLGASDQERWKIFDFFYRHQTPELISRFYNRQMRWRDWWIFFLHWPPPIPLTKALGIIGSFVLATLGWNRSKNKKSFESQ